MHIIWWGTQGEKVQAISRVLITIMNFGVVIDVVNGWACDKVSHKLWPLNRSYLNLKLPKHID